MCIRDRHHELQRPRCPIQRFSLRAAEPFPHLLQPAFPLRIGPALPTDRGCRRRADPQIVPAFPVPQIVAAPETIPGKVGHLIMMQPSLLKQPDAFKIHGALHVFRREIRIPTGLRERRPRFKGQPIRGNMLRPKRDCRAHIVQPLFQRLPRCV